MANRAAEELKEAKLYLGRENDSILSAFTASDWEFFKTLEIDPKVSYFVKGTRGKLDMFKAYFLALCVSFKPAYQEYVFSDFIEALKETTPENEEYLLGAGRELLIINIHEQSCGIGGTEEWMSSALINKIANRKLQGLTTLVLSERKFPQIEKPEVLKIISLKKALKKDKNSPFTM